ncbi:MAG: hypothetical protein ACE5FP_11220, partial [Gemmatimonadota bacterium]
MDGLPVGDGQERVVEPVFIVGAKVTVRGHHDPGVHGPGDIHDHLVELDLFAPVVERLDLD